MGESLLQRLDGESRRLDLRMAQQVTNRREAHVIAKGRTANVADEILRRVSATEQLLACLLAAAAFIHPLDAVALASAFAQSFARQTIRRVTARVQEARSSCATRREELRRVAANPRVIALRIARGSITAQARLHDRPCHPRTGKAATGPRGQLVKEFLQHCLVGGVDIDAPCRVRDQQTGMRRQRAPAQVQRRVAANVGLAIRKGIRVQIFVDAAAVRTSVQVRRTHHRRSDSGDDHVRRHEVDASQCRDAVLYRDPRIARRGSFLARRIRQQDRHQRQDGEDRQDHQDGRSAPPLRLPQVGQVGETHGRLPDGRSCCRLHHGTNGLTKRS